MTLNVGSLCALGIAAWFAYHGIEYWWVFLLMAVILR